MPKRILVVGSVNMDLVMRMNRMPGPGETLLGKDYAFIPGGKGANQAVACARLGGQVGFVGCVGQDANGQRLIDGFAAEGIDTSFIHHVEEPTGLAAIPVEENGQNRIVVFSGANHSIRAEHVEAAMAHRWDALLLQLEIPLPVVYAAVEMGKRKGIPVVLDAGPATRLAMEKLQGIDILSPNETETETLTGLSTGEDGKDEAAARALLRQSGAKAVVLKLGERGALLCENGVCTRYPAFRGLPVVDTTAAGDGFTAALALRQAMGNTWEVSMAYANAVGAHCVSRSGAQPSMPTSEEIEDFLKERLKIQV